MSTAQCSKNAYLNDFWGLLFLKRFRYATEQLLCIYGICELWDKWENKIYIGKTAFVLWSVYKHLYLKRQIFFNNIIILHEEKWFWLNCRDWIFSSMKEKKMRERKENMCHIIYLTSILLFFIIGIKPKILTVGLTNRNWYCREILFPIIGNI